MNTVKAFSLRLMSRRLWAAALAVAAVGAAGYLGFDRWTGSISTEGTVQTQLVPVTRGNLVNDVSVTGTLAYTSKETVAFRQQGAVSEIFVSAGDRVSSGDPLALLDAETIADLEKEVAQARIEVRDSEERLQDALAPYTQAQIAQAELEVAEARLELQKANEELSDLGEVSADALAQARLAVVAAQMKLDDSVESRARLIDPTSQQVARAESQVANASLALQDAREDLEALLNPSEGDITEAESEVARASLELDGAIDDLEALVTVTAIELATARTAISDAELKYRASLEEIYELETWVVSSEIFSLQASIDTAQNNLLGAKRDLQSAKESYEKGVLAASDSLDAAKNRYVGIFKSLLGLELTTQAIQSPDDILEDLGVSLEYVLSEAYIGELQSRYAQGTLMDSPSTPWNEVVVHSSVILSPAETTVGCVSPESRPDLACISDRLSGAFDEVGEEAANLELVRSREAASVREAEEAVLAAEATLESADRNLDLYITEASEFPVTEVRARVEALMLAKANLEHRREELAILLDSPDTLEFEFRQGEVASAEIRLAESLDRLASLIDQPDPLLVESMSLTVETAMADLSDAEAALDELLQAADSLVELSDREIELAQADLASAEHALSSLLADPDAIDLLVKEASVRVAQELLEEAETALEEFITVDQLAIELREAELAAAKTSLEAAVADSEGAAPRAPFDGIVISVNIKVGQQVNVSTQAFEIADPSTVEVSGSVDEIDVLYLRVGAQAFVSLEALGGQTLPGTVSSIANSGVSQQGIVTYPVSIEVNSAESGQLPEGLSATAQIIIREQSDAILIPIQALYGTVQAPMVRVASSQALEERRVQLGISDDFWVVVEEGLDEGEVVSMEVVGSSTNQFGGFGPGIGGFGGGFRGGGTPPGGGGNR